MPGIQVDGNAWAIYILMAIILGLINALVRPILLLLCCPLIILTLGLSVLIVNGLTLWLASTIAVNWFGIGFYVDGFWTAFLDALVVSLVSIILSALFKEED